MLELFLLDELLLELFFLAASSAAFFAAASSAAFFAASSACLAAILFAVGIINKFVRLSPLILASVVRTDNLRLTTTNLLFVVEIFRC